MFEDKPRIGQELLDVPMGDMIREMAFAIAEAQMKLDANSIEVAQMMGGLKQITNAATGDVTFGDSRVFFGKEKMTLGEAVALHNTTTDKTLQAAILQVANGIVTVPTATQPNIALVTGQKDDTVIFVPSRVSMLELGFTPTFYQFVDTIIEVKISIKFTAENSSDTGVSTNTSASNTSIRLRGIPGFGGRAQAGRTLVSSHVNAHYSQKYSYSAEGASLLRTKLVPIPPPAILEERIRQNMEQVKTVPSSVPSPIPA